MIVSKREGESYLFEELNITKEDKANFSNWIQGNLSNCQIQINWEG